MATAQANSPAFFSRQERRRSRRIRKATAVDIAWHKQDGTAVMVQARTEDVSAHGGRLRIRCRLTGRQVVELTHGGAANSTLARVMRTGPPTPDGWTDVAVEFAVPNSTFWQA